MKKDFHLFLVFYRQGGAKVITLLENVITFANGAKCQFGDIIFGLDGINSNGLNKEISQAEPKFFIKK